MHAAVIAVVAVVVAAAAPAPGKQRVLVLDARGAALGDDERKALTQIAAGRLANRSAFDVVAGSDLRALVGLAQEKQSAGCDSDSCLAEIAGALDAGLVVTIDA